VNSNIERGNRVKTWRVYERRNKKTSLTNEVAKMSNYNDEVAKMSNYNDEVS
jgi:hypothetical protein